MDTSKIKSVITVSTDVEMGCPFCNYRIGGGDRFDSSVQHLISEHGYALLHVGADVISPDLRTPQK
jgi:hypothetical protein